MAEKENKQELASERLERYLYENMEEILKLFPYNPTISKDDEWNDPEYDEFADKIMKRLNNEIEEK